jgi:hypothetical protein
MDQLISNGFEFDLNGFTPFPIDFTIADILDPSKRKRSKSKTIQLRGTANNCAFFINNFNLNVTGELITFDPTQRTPCVYYKKGLALMPDGVLQLNEATIEDGEITFTITIYSDAVDIFLILSTVDITDLDWSAYDHVLTRTAIKDSWTTADGTRYRYPLIERGNGRAGATIWNTTDLVLYVHMAEVLNKILEYAGISFTSPFLASARIKKILYGYGGGDLSGSISPADILARRVITDSGAFARTGTSDGFWALAFGFNSTTLNGTFNFPSTVQLSAPTFTNVEVNDALNQYSNGTITVQRSGNYSLDISGILNIALTGGNDYVSFGSMSFRIFRNGTLIGAKYTNGLSNISGTTFEYDLSFFNTYYFNSGDEIIFMVNLGQAIYTRSNLDEIIPVTQTVTTTTPIEIDMLSIDSSITDGSIVNVSRFIPPMKCSEFLVSAMRMFYLTMTDADLYGNVTISPLVDFYQPTNVFDDITHLIDRSKEIKIEPIANKFPKNHIFNYKENKDADAVRYFDKFQLRYGDYNFIQGSFYAKGDSKIELPWSSIVPYEIAPGILVPRYISIDNNGAVKAIKGAPRVCMWNGLKTGSWTFRNTDNPASFEVLGTYPCIHHFDNWQNPDFDLNYQLVNEVYYPATIVTTTNTFTEYYSPFINEVTSPIGMFVECYVKWSPMDVQRRDFSKLIMIDGALFRLNKIANFDSDKAASVKIELIKVLEARKRSTTKPTFTSLNPILTVDDLVSPIGVGTDTGVVTGGKNSTSRNSIILRG